MMFIKTDRPHFDFDTSLDDRQTERQADEHLYTFFSLPFPDGMTLQTNKVNGVAHFITVVPPTLRSLINVQSIINVQGDKFSKKNKRTGRKSSSISVQG